MKRLSILIPACNEAEVIESNLKRLDDFLKGRFDSYEIIVSEDGSRDGTGRILQRISRGNKNIVHLHSGRRLGKGRAIRRAFGLSSGRDIVMIDADLPVSPDSISRVLYLLEGKDIVIGSRNIKASDSRRPLNRTLLSLAYNSLVRLLFRSGIRDHQCGFKGFRRECMERVSLLTGSGGFFWDTEMLVRAKRMGFGVTEMPVSWRDRPTGKSKVVPLKSGLAMLMDMLRFRLG